MTIEQKEELKLEIMDWLFFRIKQFEVRGELTKEEFETHETKLNKLLKDLERSWKKLEYIDYLNKIST